ncbi:MAG: TerC family protein [Parvularculaceae bacterium]
MEFFTNEFAAAFAQVVVIDLTLAGDNAVVIGLAAAGLPASKRAKAIMIGILAATVIRIAFSVVATQLLQIVGLLLAGGVLLFWVCWKMWRELRRPAHVDVGATALADRDAEEIPGRAHKEEKSMTAAVTQIILADISMSLDNVLAVAGAAREHPVVLVFGLALSIVLMGVAATFIARVLQTQRWIAYIGLAIIFYVATEMVIRGGMEVWAEPEVRDAITGTIGSVLGRLPGA